MAFSSYSPRTKSIGVAILIALLLTGRPPFAADISVTVLDRDGNPVEGVVVYARPDTAEQLPPPTDSAIMDQLDKRFVPHILVIQSGTRVLFPNSDSVAHHVYSFSRPNDFTLPLYKGDLQPQITFEHEGVVTLGCNIHDHMLAYILIVDSRVQGVTGSDGSARLNIDNPDGLTVSIWSPRIRTGKETLTRTVNAGRSAELTFNLAHKLRAGHTDESGAIVWKQY